MKKHGLLIRIVSVLLSFTLLFSLSGCFKDYSDWLDSVAEEAGIETRTPKKTEAPTAIPGGPTDVPTERPTDEPQSGSLIPEYREVTKEAFEELCSRLTEAASKNDFSQIRTLYDQIYHEYEQLNDNYTLSYIAYCCEVSNDELSQKYQDLEALAYDLGDLACQACRAVSNGPCRDSFKSYVGEAAFSYFEEYEDMTDQEKEWQKQETELVTRYNKIIDENQDKIYKDDAYINSLVGPIYLDLVSLRTKMAQYYGYENYADYADENVYYRDYDSKAAEKYHHAVKQISAEFYDLLYFTDAYFGLQQVTSVMKPEKMIANLGSIADRISPLAGQYFDVLSEHKLYDISDEAGRLDAGYTTDFQTTGSAFIFITMQPGPRDFITLTHEFGHFINMNLVHNPNIFAYGSSMDLNEIHSNGFEGLCSYYYSEIYGQNADAALSALLVELMMNVVDGCIYDEFQRAVYENPGATLDEINSLYEDISYAYGDYYQSEYIWQYINHNFEAPMYYLSYAASGIVALQIWAKAQNDFKGAVKMWEDIQNAGPYDYGYFELLDNLDISTFDDEAAVLDICHTALDKIRKLND